MLFHFANAALLLLAGLKLAAIFPKRGDIQAENPATS
jgi:hypothetical protein